MEMPSRPLGAATSGRALQLQAVSGPTPGCSLMKRLKGMHALAWGVQMPPLLLLAKPKLLVLLIAAAADAADPVVAQIRTDAQCVLSFCHRRCLHVCSPCAFLSVHLPQLAQLQ